MAAYRVLYQDCLGLEIVGEVCTGKVGAAYVLTSQTTELVW